MPMRIKLRSRAKQCRADRSRRRLACWALCLLLAATATGGHRSLAEEQIVAIVHSENQVSNLTVHELRLMYGLFRRVWPGGTRVRIVLPPPGSSAMNFLIANIYLRPRSAVDVERFYREALFEQRIGRLPELLAPREALAFVRANRGALALFERSELPADPGIRVLEIGGAGASRGSVFPRIGRASQAVPSRAVNDSGRRILKIEPPLSGLSTWMFPEWARAISMARGRPSPSDESGWPSPR